MRQLVEVQRPVRREPAAEGVAHRLGLLVDLLEHEEVVAALLGGVGVPVDVVGLALDRRAVEVGDATPPRRTSTTWSWSTARASRVCAMKAVTSEPTKFSPSPRPTTSGRLRRAATTRSGSARCDTTRTNEPSRSRQTLRTEAARSPRSGRRRSAPPAGARRPRCRCRCAARARARRGRRRAPRSSRSCRCARRRRRRRSRSCGWALRSVGGPCVAQRVWPMASVPGRDGSVSSFSRLASLPALRSTRSVPVVVEDGDAGAVVAAVLQAAQPVEDDLQAGLAPDVAHDAAHAGQASRGPGRAGAQRAGEVVALLEHGAAQRGRQALGGEALGDREHLRLDERAGEQPPGERRREPVAAALPQPDHLGGVPGGVRAQDRLLPGLPEPGGQRAAAPVGQLAAAEQLLPDRLLAGRAGQRRQRRRRLLLAGRGAVALALGGHPVGVERSQRGQPHEQVPAQVGVEGDPGRQRVPVQPGQQRRPVAGRRGRRPHVRQLQVAARRQPVGRRRGVRVQVGEQARAVGGEPRRRRPGLLEQRLHDLRVVLGVDRGEHRADVRLRGQLAVARGVPQRAVHQRAGQRVVEARRWRSARWPATGRPGAAARRSGRRRWAAAGRRSAPPAARPARRRGRALRRSASRSAVPSSTYAPTASRCGRSTAPSWRSTSPSTRSSDVPEVPQPQPRPLLQVAAAGLLERGEQVGERGAAPGVRGEVGAVRRRRTPRARAPPAAGAGRSRPWRS